MMDLEQELKRALRREPAPPDFVERVMRRIEREGADPEVSVVHPWRAVAAAGLLTIFLGGWAAREAAVQRARGERAREDVLLALRITSEKLRDAKNHVHEIGSRD
jgi:anti-sigma factor RsiW